MYEIEEGWTLKFAKIDQYGDLAAPPNWRHPRTLTTITWRDGAISPVFVTVPDKALSDKEIAALNKDCCV